jgi:hypothetical protein
VFELLHLLNPSFWRVLNDSAQQPQAQQPHSSTTDSHQNPLTQAGVCGIDRFVLLMRQFTQTLVCRTSVCAVPLPDPATLQSASLGNAKEPVAA